MKSMNDVFEAFNEMFDYEKVFEMATAGKKLKAKAATEKLLTNLGSIGWKTGLAEESIQRIAGLGFRNGNDCLAVITCELALECQPITLRGLFYRVVSAGFFDSTANQYYKRTGRIVSKLRERGLIPYEWIVDNLRATLKPSSWSGLQDFTVTVRDAYRKDYWSNLPSYVHIFCEKDAIAGVIEPVTVEYDVRLSPIRGYCSDSFAYEIGNQWSQIDKPIFAYYLGDYDPSGFDIERDLEKKLRRHAGPDARISWERLGVVEEHFDQFDLIELEPKKLDKRYKKFAAEHGERCAEIDAIPPPEIRSMVEAVIKAQIDEETWERMQIVEQAEKESFCNVLDKLSA